MKIAKKFILLSLYFNEYEYIMNLLSYEEIKEIFDNVNVYLKDKNIVKNSFILLLENYYVGILQNLLK